MKWMVKFHVDACQPRHPRGKGKVERHVRELRETVDPRREAFVSLEHLQAATDARLEERAKRLRCPITPSPTFEHSSCLASPGVQHRRRGFVHVEPGTAQF